MNSRKTSNASSRSMNRSMNLSEQIEVEADEASIYPYCVLPPYYFDRILSKKNTSNGSAHLEIAPWVSAAAPDSCERR